MPTISSTEWKQRIKMYKPTPMQVDFHTQTEEVIVTPIDSSKPGYIEIEPGKIIEVTEPFSIPLEKFTLTLDDLYEAKKQLDANCTATTAYEEWAKLHDIPKRLPEGGGGLGLDMMEDWKQQDETFAWTCQPESEEETKFCTCDIRMLAHFQGCQCGGK